MRILSRSGRFFSITLVLAVLTLAAGCTNMLNTTSRMLGTASLGSSTIRGHQTLGREYKNAGSMPSTAIGSQAVGTRAQDLPPAQNQRGGPARQMVYSARFDVATPNVEEAMGQFIRRTESVGGYLDSREDARVVCRVPAAEFQEIVTAMPSLGSILSQTIRNDDVTRKHQDLKLHLETAEWSRQRVLGLLEKAQKIEDIIKLEEELLKLTAAIESLKGTMEDLSEQIAYSRVEVQFRAKVSESRIGRPDANSPFAWINRIGAEQVMGDFGSAEGTANVGMSSVAAMLSGTAPTGPLEGFLIVTNDGTELKAITPDASKLWAREFPVSKRANLDFWSKALRSDLVDHRGYALRGEKTVRDRRGNEGVELVCDVPVQGQPHRYMVSIYAVAGPFWNRGSTVRTIEFVAPVATFEKCAAVVCASYGQTASGEAGQPPAK